MSLTEEFSTWMSEPAQRRLYEAFADSQPRAEQCLWNCEDGWIVGYTTSRIVNGRNDGRFAVMAYKPNGKNSRSKPKQAEEWVRTYMRPFSTRKAAKRRAVQLYYRHSPKAAARHGV